MRQAYYRASKAMLITSLTTCGAFMVTAINSLNDIACFGIFTATLVAINFFYVSDSGDGSGDKKGENTYD